MHPIDHEVKRVRLTITEKCNLKCSYCFEENKNYCTLSLEDALKIVESELSDENNGFKRVIIDLFGGEPFVEFELLKDICEYAWDRTWKADYKFWTTTNGTMITNDIKRWLTLNKERISCGLSLDGDRQVHNLNRGESFDKIPIDFFADAWPDRPVRSVICPNTIQYLYESVLFLQNRFRRIKNRLAWGVAWDKEGIDEILEDQLSQLVNYYIENPDLPICSMLDIDFSALLPEYNEKQVCGVGYNHVAYDVFGVKYPCAQFQSLCHDGIIQYDQIYKLDFQNRLQYLESKCRTCYIRDICQTCYAQCYTHYQENAQNCRTFKRIVRKSAILKKARSRDSNPLYDEIRSLMTKELNDDL